MSFDSDSGDGFLLRPQSFNIKVQRQLGELVKARNLSKCETYPLQYAQTGLTTLKHKNNTATVPGKNPGY